MLRAKRPRSMHSSHSGQNHSHNNRTRSMSEDNLGDDHLMHMDPSLMTERQQLAFLLRTTAQEHSGGDSPTAHSESSDEDTAPRVSKRPKKRIPSAKTSPVNAPKNGGTSANQSNNKTLASSHSRPAKHSPKRSVAVGDDALSPRAQRAARTTTKHLHVKTSTPTGSDSEEVGAVMDKVDTSKSTLKPSPSSTSDVAHISVFDEHCGQGEFWSLHCALCSQSAPLFDTACEPLFLCQSCDKKYPTQRALGRI